MLKRLFFTSLVIFSLSLSSCLKDVKDSIDESVDALECANTLQRINNDEGNIPCSELTNDINSILNSCDDFLTQEEKDSLIFARDNCQDN